MRYFNSYLLLKLHKPVIILTLKIEGEIFEI